MDRLDPSQIRVGPDWLGASPVEPELAPEVGVVDDGPLFVTGRVPVTLADGTAYEVRARMTLCRCGGSKNKPFCDGTHAELGFTDHG